MTDRTTSIGALDRREVDWKSTVTLSTTNDRIRTHCNLKFCPYRTMLEWQRMALHPWLGKRHSWWQNSKRKLKKRTQPKKSGIFIVYETRKRCVKKP